MFVIDYLKLVCNLVSKNFFLREHVSVIHVSVFQQNDGNLAAIVKVR